jgi:hypothetical protein
MDNDQEDQEPLSKVKETGIFWPEERIFLLMEDSIILDEDVFSSDLWLYPKNKSKSIDNKKILKMTKMEEFEDDAFCEAALKKIFPDCEFNASLNEVRISEELWVYFWMMWGH